MHFELLCDQLYGSNIDTQTRQSADNALKTFIEEPGNLGLLKQFLENTQQVHAQALAASALKNLFVKHWAVITADEKIAIKDYILNFLAAKGPSLS